MKAWQLHHFNGLSALKLEEIAEPMAGPGEAVVSLKLAALNPADRYLSQGEYPAKPPLPHILGRDGMGIVRSVGAGVTQLKIGDRVLILRGDVGVNRAGTFAEKVAAPVEWLAPIPDGWSDEQAGSAALVYLTAWQSITQWSDLKPNSVALISGASGGVGVAAVQLAKAMGHVPIALSRSAEKRKRLEELGAAITLDPNDASWPTQLKEKLAPRKVDLAIDQIGGKGFSELIGVLGDHGKVSVVGRLAGPVPEFNTASLFFRRIKIGGVAVGTYKARESQEAWRGIVEMLNRSGAQAGGGFGFCDGGIVASV